MPTKLPRTRFSKPKSADPNKANCKNCRIECKRTEMSDGLCSGCLGVRSELDSIDFTDHL